MFGNCLNVNHAEFWEKSLPRQFQTLTCHPDMIKLCRLLILFCIYGFNGQNQFLPVQWVLYSHFLQQKPLTKSLPCLWLLSLHQVTVKIDAVDSRKVEAGVDRISRWGEAVITFSMSWGVAVNSVCPDVTHCRAKITYWPRPKSSSQLQTLSVLHWANGALWSLKSTRNSGEKS